MPRVGQNKPPKWTTSECQNQQSYAAKLDGKDVPYVGDPGTTSVSLKRIGDSIEETDKRDGKVISVSKMTVAPDGKTMTIVVADKLHGSTATYVAEKQ